MIVFLVIDEADVLTLDPAPTWVQSRKIAEFVHKREGKPVRVDYSDDEWGRQAMLLRDADGWHALDEDGVRE